MKGLILPENPLRYYKMCRLKDLSQGLNIQNVAKKTLAFKKRFYTDLHTNSLLRKGGFH